MLTENDGFSFDREYILQDERVLLRPLTMEDFDFLVEYSIHEPHLFQYSLSQAIGEEGLKNYLQDALNARHSHTAYPWIVFDKKTNKYVGSTRFYDIQINNKTTQLGYTWYGSAWHGSGLNIHCKYLLLEFAFETLGWERVEFRADFDNKRSIAAMKKIGCVEEGILRNHAFKADGTRRTSIILSILAEEWRANVKAKLKEII